MTNALERIKAARVAERIRARRAPVLPETANEDEGAPDAGCTECGRTLTSPVESVTPDEPISAAAVAVRNAIVFPSEHFEKWDTSGQEWTPLTWAPDGHVFGHAAGDGCFRNGDVSWCERYEPDPDPRLRNFHTWTTTLDDGRVIRTGALTAAANHADVMNMTREQARAYHENTSTVVARVIAWEDERGRLAISGSMVPGLSDDMIGRAAGAPISVEQYPTRETGGRNTLTAAHLVVTPAWPVLA